MVKCKYCAVDENGDTPEYWESLIYSNFIINTHEELKGKSISASSDYKKEFNADVGICNGVLCLDVFSTEDDSDNNYFSYTLKVNYCPVCGRKLNRGDAS